MSVTPGSPQLPDHVSRITGPLLLGYLFNWGLFGALSVQVYNYHASFPHDSVVSKTVVYGVYLAELAQTIIATRDCFATYAIGFGKPAAINDIQTIWLSAPIMVGLISCTVQLYYAYRVHKLSRSKIVALVICALAVMQCAGAIVQGAQLLHIGNFHDLAHKARASCIVWFVGSASCDVVITYSISHMLLRHDYQIPETRTLVIKVVRLIIETGTLTAAAAILDLIVFLALPNEIYHTAITFALAKFYSNSLMVLLNNRTHLRSSEVHSVSVDANAVSRMRGVGGRASEAITLQSGGIHVQQTTIIATDDIIPLEDRSTKKPHSLSDV